MRPKNSLGYSLHHLSFVLDRQADLLLQERLGIGFSQFKILMALQWQACTQQRYIAEYLGQTEASVSRQIKLLHELGLLKNQISSHSRRERVTTLTTKGEKLANEAMKQLNKFYEPILSHLSSRQQETLSTILEIMHEEVCRSDKRGACQTDHLSK